VAVAVRRREYFERKIVAGLELGEAFERSDREL